MGYLKFQSIDPVTGNEIWADSDTGVTEMRPNTRTTTQTQSIPATNTGPTTTLGAIAAPTIASSSPETARASGAGTVGNTTARATQSPGIGAGRDDSAKPTSNGTQQLINASFNGPITPQPNILDQYASYTYQISWYLLTPDQVTGLSENRLDPVRWQLLVQDGGAPTTTTTAGYSNFGKSTTTGRNKFFSYDYYIDNLVIEAVLPLKGTHSANGNQSIEFKLTEPNGISLLANLYSAIDDLYKSQNISSKGDYLTAAYCLGIRFFGYDDKGNLVQGNRNGAISEKYYPFRLKSINFRLTNRVIEYTIQGNPIPYNIGFGSDRGTIPFAFNLSGQTLDELFNGKEQAVTKASGEDGRTDTKGIPKAPFLAGTNIPASIDTENLGVSKTVSNNGWGEG